MAKKSGAKRRCRKWFIFNLEKLEIYLEKLEHIFVQDLGKSGWLEPWCEWFRTSTLALTAALYHYSHTDS